MTRDYFIDRNIFLNADTVVPVSEEINFPATNILNDLYFRRWRVAGAVAEVDFSYLTDQTLRELVLRFPTNRDPTDTPHVFGVNDAMTLKLWDTNPAGTLLHNATTALNVDPLGYSHWDIGADIVHRYARLTLNCPDLIANGGQLEVENIFGGVPAVPKANFNAGGGDEDDDKTDVVIGEFSGASIGEPRARLLSLQREWDVWTDADIAWWISFKRRHGQIRSFAFISRPHRPLVKQVLIARFADGGAPKLVENNAGNMVVSTNIIEKR